jgi:hypothetical protein
LASQHAGPILTTDEPVSTGNAPCAAPPERLETLTEPSRTCQIDPQPMYVEGIPPAPDGAGGMALRALMA